MPEAIENLGNPALVEQVCNEILEGDSTAWEDIAGQDDAKRLVQELVVWPMLNPALCTVRDLVRVSSARDLGAPREICALNGEALLRYEALGI